MKFLKYLVYLFLFFIFATIGPVIVYRYFPVPYTLVMFLKPGKIEKQWVDFKDISPSMKKAVLRAEDNKFYDHYGFDFEAIDKAIKYNKTHKKQKGASTITQQTAKNVFLWPSRSWIRKGMEAYFTILIEVFWTKDRILEVYLNVIELGKGVYGVEAAAQKFFRKKAKNLNASEAALMAAVLPNPIKFKINKPSPYILRRQQKIMGPRYIEAQFDADEDTEADPPTEAVNEEVAEPKSETDSSAQVTPENTVSPDTATQVTPNQ